jgi:signal transduction histidine kinase
LASEREQQRIGRDLHDSLGSHLAAIGYALSFLTNDLRQRDQPAAAKTEVIHGLVNDAGSLLRDLVQGIFPELMNGFGLSMALEELASNTSRQSGMSVSFYETGNTLINDPDNSMHLYRIVQEAVNNALKHSDAKKVTIVLNKSENSVHLAIVDDGRSMAPTSNGARGMGLHSMKYRARALGGDLKIDSSPSSGTIVSCEIPNRPSLPLTPTS